MSEEHPDEILDAAWKWEGLDLVGLGEGLVDLEPAEELQGGHLVGDPAHVDLVARRHEEPFVVVTPRHGGDGALKRGARSVSRFEKGNEAGAVTRLLSEGYEK